MVKWYSFEIIIYAIFIALVFVVANDYGRFFASQTRLSSLYHHYSSSVAFARSGYRFIFNPLTYVLIFYFWFNRKHLSTNDFFIGMNYFAIFLGMIVFTFPDHIIGRMIYFFLAGACILCGKLILTDFRLGIVCLFVIIFYAFTMLSRPRGAQSLTMLVHGELLNPFYGLVGMIYNYHSFLALPGLDMF